MKTFKSITITTLITASTLYGSFIALEKLSDLTTLKALELKHSSYLYARSYFVHPESPKTLLALATDAAQEFSLPLDLGLAFIDTESNWNPDAVKYEAAYDPKHTDSSRYFAHSVGLTQVIPHEQNLKICSDIVEYKSQLADPKTNIRCGFKIMSYLVKRFKSYKLAIAAYNCGEGCVSKGQIPASTVEYTKKVLAAYNLRIENRFKKSDERYALLRN